MESAGGGSKEAPSRPLTAEEEAIKRSTDCVYFLASPLTCKKGAECEYRHSEGARMNPRDCYFWLNGSCLNPKCLFRHPPIEGLFGNPGNNSVQAPSLPTIPKPQMPAVHQPASYNPNKQSTPCFYFQKGLCLKGDRCSFMHGPLPAGTPIPHQQVPKVTESSAQLQQTLVKKEPWVLKGCTSQQNTLKVSAEKPVEVPVIRAESGNYLGLVHERGPSPHTLQTDIPRSQLAVFPVSSGQDGDLPQHSDEQSLNGGDADEFVGESSPGFDVLVDDEIEDPEYLGNEDELGTEQGQVGRNLYPVTELNYRRSEYEAVGGFEGDRFDGAKDYGRNGGVVRDRYSRERPSMSERRRAPQRGESPEEMDGSDLRHRLLKQRRLNSSRSDAGPDHRGGPYRREDRRSDEERYHSRRPHREQQQQVHRESPISARLQGRVTLPARPLPDSPLDPRSDRERRDRVSRLRGRLSPPRVINNYRDRTNRTSHESSRGGQPIRSQNAEPQDFAGPKSLAELKGSKPSENSQERKLSERRSGSGAGYQGSNGSASFQGPKPLSDILKRKREATPEDYDNRRADAIVSEVKKEDEPKIPSVEEEEEEGLIASSADELDQASPKDAAEEIEEGAMFDSVEDHEEEIQIQYEGNEEPEYAAIEGDDAKAENQESLYHDGDEVMEDDNDVLDEEDDDDDEDDFARKVGVMFS